MSWAPGTAPAGTSSTLAQATLWLPTHKRLEIEANRSFEPLAIGNLASSARFKPPSASVPKRVAVPSLKDWAMFLFYRLLFKFLFIFISSDVCTAFLRAHPRTRREPKGQFGVGLPPSA